MGPTWVLSAPGGPHVGPMNLAIGVGCELENNKITILTQHTLAGILSVSSGISSNGRWGMLFRLKVCDWFNLSPASEKHACWCFLSTSLCDVLMVSSHRNWLEWRVWVYLGIYFEINSTVAIFRSPESRYYTLQFYEVKMILWCSSAPLLHAKQLSISVSISNYLWHLIIRIVCKISDLLIAVSIKHTLFIFA